jgi:hypothetical protein
MDDRFRSRYPVNGSLRAAPQGTAYHSTIYVRPGPEVNIKMITFAALLLNSGCTVNVDSNTNLTDETTDEVEDVQPKEDLSAPDRGGRDPDNGDRNDGQDGEQVGDADSAGAVDAGYGGENTLYFVNGSRETICWVYVEPCSGGGLSDDLLGRDVLPRNWYLEITGLESTCYDFWAFDCDDDHYWTGRFELDGSFTWLLYGGGGAGGGVVGGTDTGFDTAWDTAFETGI